MGRSHTWSRAVRWGGPVLLGAAYLAVLVAWPGTRTAVVVDDLGNLASPLFAGACCLVAARRLNGRLRRTWLLLGGWALTWAGGQAAWCAYEVVLGRTVPFPGLPDVGYVLAVPFAIGALLVHPDAPRLVHGRLRLLSEGLMVATGLLALIWRVVLADAYAVANGLGPAQVLGLAYRRFPEAAWRWRCSTWTASRPSTTAGAMRPAMTCSCWWQPA